jgi:hypothetical protein
MAAAAAADFSQLIARLAQALADRELPFMLIGGQAVLLHGEPRLTQDIDVTIGASPARLEDALAACNAAGLAPLPDDVASFVRDTFVLPAADGETGIRVDLIFSNTPSDPARGPCGTERCAGSVRFGLGRDPAQALRWTATRPGGRSRRVARKGRELDWVYIRGWATEFTSVPGRERVLQQAAELQRRQ